MICKGLEIGLGFRNELIKFLHFNNCKREHTTTGQIPNYVLDNFNNEKVREIFVKY